MLRDKPSLNDNNVLCIFFLMFIFLAFSGSPDMDKGGRLFEKKVLEVLGDKNSIELPIAHFISFDWDTMRVVRYARYTNFLRDIGVKLIYSLEFRVSSGVVVKEIILPLRFAHIDHDGPITPGYRSIPYIWEERFGRNRRFKITHMENVFRNGGNGLKIEII